MEEVPNLRKVLDRVENKLIASGKVYVAMSFVFWMIIMLLYFLIFPNVKLPLWTTAVYWAAGILIYLWFSSIIFRYYRRLRAPLNRKVFRRTGIFIGLSWAIGGFVGMGIIPDLSVGINSITMFSIGYLSFISISVFGEWLTFRGSDLEMIPAIVIPIVGIPLALYLSSSGTNPFFWAVLVVSLAFSSTILSYLYSAFKLIR